MKQTKAVEEKKLSLNQILIFVMILVIIGVYGYLIYYIGYNNASEYCLEGLRNLNSCIENGTNCLK